MSRIWPWLFWIAVLAVAFGLAIKEAWYPNHKLELGARPDCIVIGSVLVVAGRCG